MKYQQTTLLLWKLFWRSYSWVIIVFLGFSFIAGICEISFVFLLRSFVLNEVASPVLVISLTLSLMVFRTVVQIFNIRFLSNKLQKWTDEIKNNLYQNMLRKAFPLSRLDASKEWKRLHVQLFPFMRTGLFSLLFSVSAGIQILLCLCTIFIFPWIFVLSLFVLLFPLALFSRWRIKILNKASSKWVEAQSQNDGEIENLSNAFDFVYGNQQLEMALENVVHQNTIRGKKEVCWNILQWIFPYIMEFLYFVLALVLFSIILPSFNFVTDLLPFIILMLLLYRPIREWSRLYPDISLGNQAFLNWNHFVKKIENSPDLKPKDFHDLQTIECLNLNFNYEEKNVFSNLNLILDLTKITFLIGSNGIGKTTFLKLLARIEFPKSGTILHSKDFKEISYLSQRPVFSPFWLDQTQSLKKEYPEDFKALDLILKISPLLKRLKKPSQVEDLSGGEKQRLHLLQCLLRPCPFILMDEPTTWISLGTQVKLIQDLITYWKKRWEKVNQPAGMLIVSHDQNMEELAEVKINF